MGDDGKALARITRPRGLDDRVDREHPRLHDDGLVGDREAGEIAADAVHDETHGAGGGQSRGLSVLQMGGLQCTWGRTDEGRRLAAWGFTKPKALWLAKH